MLPLDRQVQITAGTMALTGFTLGELVNPNWFLLAGFVGCGLVFAGVTGFCPLGWVIAKMPWNQAGRDEAAVRRASLSSDVPGSDSLTVDADDRRDLRSVPVDRGRESL